MQLVFSLFIESCDLFMVFPVFMTYIHRTIGCLHMTRLYIARLHQTDHVLPVN
ncbi:hypothetical protein ES288_D08G108100v1 [Gossypium darwinii]|uniref:Uncharacterized protein n=1 Tax=Gossypium darwinii TaxID=34276 RepID=A0A5D2BLM3_GOSDA|nr:hypothetical protein ES288_D08G108100v1 [Gossypium darwinii]